MPAGTQQELIALHYLLYGRPQMTVEIQQAVDLAAAKRRSKGCYDRSFNPLTKPPPLPVRIRIGSETPAELQTLEFLEKMHRDHDKRCLRCGHGK